MTEEERESRKTDGDSKVEQSSFYTMALMRPSEKGRVVTVSQEGSKPPMRNPYARGLTQRLRMGPPVPRVGGELASVSIPSRFW